MCGIVGYVGSKPLVPVLMDGLRRLEYRGYDSAGIAVVRNGRLEIRRSAGKLSNLDDVLVKQPLEGDYGIGHTRWATHGRPTEENAHPHRDCHGRIVVVHNGIIENYLELKRELTATGHRFVTETDTEIVAHLVEREMRDDGLVAAVRRSLTHLRGLFALVLISADDPDTIVAVRNGPPVVVGLGRDEFFVASDIPAILSHTRDVVFLDDREIAIVTRAGVQFTDFSGAAIEKTPQHITWDPVMAEKAGYPHFMLKEIYEQPWAVRETVLGRTSLESGRVFLQEVQIPEATLAGIERVAIVACGTSWHAGLVGKFLIEELARIPVEVDYGSEFRYRRPHPLVDRAHADGGDHAVRRDRRHPRRDAGSEAARHAEHRDLQRRRQHGDARGRRDGLYACWTRNRRRVDEGLHLTTRGAASCSRSHLGRSARPCRQKLRCPC